MRKLGLKTIIVLFSLLSAAPALADQKDARLEDLFSQLLAAPGPAEAQIIEGAIWHIWGQSDDGAVRALMEDGVAAMSRRDYRRALSRFEQMVAIAPDFAEGWNKRATVHYLMGNYSASLEDIVRTLELEPRHFGALSGRGLVYVALEDEQRALNSFEEALAIHPNLVSAAVNAEALRKSLREKQI